MNRLSTILCEFLGGEIFEIKGNYIVCTGAYSRLDDVNISLSGKFMSVFGRLCSGVCASGKIVSIHLQMFVKLDFLRFGRFANKLRVHSC